MAGTRTAMTAEKIAHRNREVLRAPLLRIPDLHNFGDTSRLSAASVRLPSNAEPAGQQPVAIIRYSIGTNECLVSSSTSTSICGSNTAPVGALASASPLRGVTKP